MGKSKFMAISSFFFGMTFLIPLINLIFGFLAIIIGLRALSKIRKDPEAYGGKWLAIAGISLGAMVYIGYAAGLGICLSGNQEVCKTLGVSFLS